MLEASRRAPRLAGAHPGWRSTLASTFYGFRVLSNADIVPVFLFAFCTRLDQACARFCWVWLEAAPVETRRVQGLDLGLVRGLLFLPRAARSCLRDWSPVASRRAFGSGAASPASRRVRPARRRRAHSV